MIVSLDCTVWPSNAPLLVEAVKTMSTVLAMSSNNMGFVQYPVFQSQTNHLALVKHSHTLDNLIVQNKMVMYYPIQILYSKPDSTAGDARSLAQPAKGVFHSNYDGACAFTESAAVKEGKLGACPLIRISQLLGYDECRRPGASARVEQPLGNNKLFGRCYFGFFLLGLVL